MYEALIANHLIGIEGLLLLHYKKLSINEVQAMIILLVLRLEKNNTQIITPNVITQYMTLDNRIVDREVMTLINKQLLSIEGNSLSSKPLINAILKLENHKEEAKENKINLVACFEKEFSRPLTPIEIEILKEWKQCQYEDQFILDALKEATLSNVKNMRYIEKILIDWAKYGKKTSGRNQVVSNQETIQLVDYDWWNEK